MRLAIEHQETLRFEAPSQGTIQVLRLTPRDHHGHYVCTWDVNVDADCKMETSKDAFGNILTSFSVTGPLEQLTISASGEVETEDTHGIVRGTVEKVPDGVFRRPSHDEQQCALVRALIATAGEQSQAPLGQMHTMMEALHHALLASAPEQADTQLQAQTGTHKAGPQQAGSQAEAKKLATQAPNARLAQLLAKAGSLSPGQSASLFCDGARHLGMPARLVSGYRLLEAPSQNKAAREIWAEVRLDELGWIGFDPHHNSCPAEESVRVANGLDAPSIATFRLGHYGNRCAYEQETSIAVRRLDG